MTKVFVDSGSLALVSPMAIASYARSEGWVKWGRYGDFSDVYVSDGKPELVVPRTDSIDDYTMVVRQLVSVLGTALERDEVSVYRDLSVADRDVVRVRALDSAADGMAFDKTHVLWEATRSMLIASVKSVDNNAGVYQPQLTGRVAQYLNRLHVSHTEAGSFSLVLLSPAVSPIAEESMGRGFDFADVVPPERRMVSRLSESLFATREAAEFAAGGDFRQFAEGTCYGVSANLCEAVADLVEGVCPFDVSFHWALTRPSEAKRGPVRFSHGDVAILRQAAGNFRMNSPEYGRRLYGFVYRLARPEDEVEGAVWLQTVVDGRSRSVASLLNPSDYGLVIEAHRTKAIVGLEGDLVRRQRSLQLLNAVLIEVIQSPRIEGLESDGVSLYV